MALQTSGAISLNDIHVEAGGTSGTTCSLNDSDIRGLISKGSGVTMSFSEWYGASASWSGTMTLTGTAQPTPYTLISGYEYDYIYNGTDFSIGSLSDTSVDNLGGVFCVSMSNLNGTNNKFAVSGNVANSGWTNLTVTSGGGTAYVFPRTAASYSYDSSTNRTTWLWSSPYGTNPYTGGSSIPYSLT